MTFEIDETVKCFFNDVAYPARIQKIDLSKKSAPFFVHYLQWNKRYDQWVPLSKLQKVNESPKAITKLSRSLILTPATSTPKKGEQKPAKKEQSKLKPADTKPVANVPAKLAPIGRKSLAVESKNLSSLQTRNGRGRSGVSKPMHKKGVLLSSPNLQRILDKDIVAYKSTNGKRFLTLDDIKEHCAVKKLNFVESDYDFSLVGDAPETKKSTLANIRRSATKSLTVKDAKKSQAAAKSTKIPERRRKSLKLLPRLKAAVPGKVALKKSPPVRNSAQPSAKKSQPSAKRRRSASIPSRRGRAAFTSATSSKGGATAAKRLRATAGLTPSVDGATSASSAADQSSSVLWSPPTVTSPVSDAKGRAAGGPTTPRYTDMASESDATAPRTTGSSKSRRSRSSSKLSLDADDIIVAQSAKKFKKVGANKRKRKSDAELEMKTKKQKTSAKSKKTKNKSAGDSTKRQAKKLSTATIDKRGKKKKIEQVVPEFVEIQDEEPLSPNDIRLPVVTSGEDSAQILSPGQKPLTPGLQVFQSSSRMKSLSESSSVDGKMPDILGNKMFGDSSLKFQPRSQHFGPYTHSSTQFSQLKGQKLQYDPARYANFSATAKLLSPSKKQFSAGGQQLPFHFRQQKMDQHGLPILSDADIEEGLQPLDNSSTVAPSFGTWRGMGRSRGRGGGSLSPPSHVVMKFKGGRGGRAGRFSHAVPLNVDDSAYSRRRDSSGTGSDSEFTAAVNYANSEQVWRQIAAPRMVQPPGSASFQYLPPQVVEDHCYGRANPGGGGSSAADFPSYIAPAISSAGLGQPTAINRNTASTGYVKQPPQQRQLLVRSFSPPYQRHFPTGATNNGSPLGSGYSPMLYAAGGDLSPNAENGNGPQPVGLMSSPIIKPSSLILPKLSMTSSPSSFAKPHGMTSSSSPTILLPSPLLLGSSATPSLLMTSSASVAAASAGPMLAGVHRGHVTAVNKMPANILEEDETEGLMLNDEDQQPITSVVID